MSRETAASATTVPPSEEVSDDGVLDASGRLVLENGRMIIGSTNHTSFPADTSSSQNDAERPADDHPHAVYGDQDHRDDDHGHRRNHDHHVHFELPTNDTVEEDLTRLASTNQASTSHALTLSRVIDDHDRLIHDAIGDMGASSSLIPSQDVIEISSAPGPPHETGARSIVAMVASIEGSEPRKIRGDDDHQLRDSDEHKIVEVDEERQNLGSSPAYDQDDNLTRHAGHTPNLRAIRVRATQNVMTDVAKVLAMESAESPQEQDDQDQDQRLASENSTPKWPQSYRQSMDAYSQSPTFKLLTKRRKRRSSQPQWQPGSYPSAGSQYVSGTMTPASYFSTPRRENDALGSKLYSTDTSPHQQQRSNAFSWVHHDADSQTDELEGGGVASGVGSPSRGWPPYGTPSSRSSFAMAGKIADTVSNMSQRLAEEYYQASMKLPPLPFVKVPLKMPLLGPKDRVDPDDKTPGSAAPPALSYGPQLPSPKDWAMYESELDPSQYYLFHDQDQAKYEERQGSSTVQALCNGMNVLVGVGILTTPYALAQVGWSGLLLMLVLAGICCHTGIILKYCMEGKDVETFPDIGEAAFGSVGRLVISVILYSELYACTVEFLILEGDNLSSVFPTASVQLLGMSMSAREIFVIAAALCILPTVMMRDLSILSYVSAAGVVAALIVVVSLMWVGVMDVGLSHRGKFVDFSNIPVAIGLFGFCFSGHAVFPNIYKSMQNPEQYTFMLKACFGACLILYGSVAIVGYLMFGNEIKSQITLNLPKDSPVSKIALWTTIVNPFTKYALTMTPIALSLEELCPWPESSLSYRSASIAIRAGLVMSTVIVALKVPFFGYVMAFIGSFLTIAVSVIVPSACYLKILGNKATLRQVLFYGLIMSVGLVCAILGSYSSIAGIIRSWEKEPLHPGNPTTGLF